jgi:hypothetical protein
VPYILVASSGFLMFRTGRNKYFDPGTDGPSTLTVRWIAESESVCSQVVSLIETSGLSLMHICSNTI